MFLLVPLAFVCAMENILTKTVKNCKSVIKPIENELILGLVIILVALTGFGLGRLSKLEERKLPITVEKITVSADLIGGAGEVNNLGVSGTTIQQGDLVASKNGTKYHYLWCPGSSTIKEENKIYFSSKEEAENAGYKPAVNCKGL